MIRIVNIISYLIIQLFFAVILLSCSSSIQLIDRKGTFEEWSKIPNNGTYLEINMYEASSRKKVKGRAYFLSYDGCGKSNDNLAIVELNLKSGIMNKFPIPSNQRSIVLNDIVLFPPLKLLDIQLEVSATHSIDTANLVFIYTKNFMDPERHEVLKKKVTVFFDSKVGLIEDLSEEGDLRIWY